MTVGDSSISFNKENENFYKRAKNMNIGINRDNQGNVTLNEASDGGQIDNRTIINIPRLYAWIALAVAGMICATVLVCHFTPQEQCVKVTIDGRQAKNNGTN